MRIKYNIFLFLIFIPLLTFITSCTLETRLDSEETHKLCETYAEKVGWIKSATAADLSPAEELSVVAKRYNSAGTPLCLFEVTAVEESDTETGLPLKLTLLIKEVYCGDTSLKDREIERFTGLTVTENALAGQKYVGYLSSRDTLYFFNPYWTFLITDDNTLVSPFGCPVEDEEEVAKGNLSVDSRNYTGQKLDYFIAKVKEVG